MGPPRLRRRSFKGETGVSGQVSAGESWPWWYRLPACTETHVFEVRTTAPGGIYRVLFCLDGSTMVPLHAFKKTSRLTPKPDLDLTRKRKKELQDDL